MDAENAKNVMAQDEAEEIVKEHEKWVNGNGKRGKRADFSGKRLEKICFVGKNLQDAIFDQCVLVDCLFSECVAVDAVFSKTKIEGTTFNNCVLCDANFDCAFITQCCFLNVNLFESSMMHSQMLETMFSCSDLTSIDFTFCDMVHCSAEKSNFSGSRIGDNNFKEIHASNRTAFYDICCPEEGAFVGFKKARCYGAEVIVKLLITENAKRGSACSRKCRASEVKVLGIYDLDRNELPNVVASSYWKYGFHYKVGETISIEDFDENRWNECSTGIHFFLTFDEAARFCM